MKKGNLLIVDDEILILSRLEILLEDLADQIFRASNGEEALEVIEKEKVHCVICDVNMPKISGLELIQEIRKRDISVPFIFYTGHGSEEMMLEVAKYGTFDFLYKPSLKGLEEITITGLKRGLDGGKGRRKDNPVEYLSEYQKLLQALNKN